MSAKRARYIFFFELAVWAVIVIAAIAMSVLAHAASDAKSLPAGAQPAPPEPDGYWTGPINGAVPATLRGATVLRTQDLSALLKDRKVVLIDASNAPQRPEHLAPNSPWLPVPHPAIPGTLWIPGSGMGEIAPEIDALYRAQLAAATENDFDHPLVVYCHERCWLSYNAARRAIAYGYRRVYWYPDGIEGWRAAKLPTAPVKAIER